jgi:hypothetical protein
MSLIFQADPLEQFAGPGLGLILSQAFQAHRREHDVPQDVEVGKQIEILEYHPHFLSLNVDVVAYGGDINAFEHDLAVGGLLQQIEAAQEGAFPRARRADDHHHLSLSDAHVDALEDVQLAEILVKIRYLNHRFSSSSRRRREPWKC